MHLISRAKYWSCVAFPGLALLSGCVPIPYWEPRSPAVSGRVVDASARTPVTGAAVTFLDPEYHSLGWPKTKSDATGHFAFSRKLNYHLFAVPAAHAMQGIPGGLEASYLRIEHPGYTESIINLDVVFRKSGLVKSNDPLDRHILSFDGNVPLPNVPLRQLRK